MSICPFYLPDETWYDEEISNVILFYDGFISILNKYSYFLSIKEETDFIIIMTIIAKYSIGALWKIFQNFSPI